ncbi:SpaA isopeptide-forming pilin-related protein [Blautia sp. MCC283]|uniref:SpaA isopeptide-forming pilin-related protein n=1 Tax=Blautia sp. MCC283 TaxID=2592640 RepID=UPI001C00BFB6|nr:SpaA isopeptide-forming pilin-related protein [Blautia sp. MCC283]MBT9840462.1 VWA domain-containing protein [Blautia sp. MCC283]
MKRLKKDKIKKILAFMVALALMVSCVPSAYTISASETFGDGTEDFTDGESVSGSAAEEATPDVSSADQGEQAQQQSTLTYENDSVKVTAEAQEEGALPQNTTLRAESVNENSSVSYDTVSQKLAKAAEDKGSSLKGFVAYDVYFADADGNRVEPNGRVNVTIEYKTPAAPELTDAASTSVTAEKLHYNSNTGETEVTTLQPNEELKVLNVNESKQLQTLQVQTSNAAVFAVMWDAPEVQDAEDEISVEAEEPAADGDFTDGDGTSDPEVTPTETPAADPTVTEAPADDLTDPDDGNTDATITPEPAAQPVIVEVIGEDVNLRVSPSTEADVATTIPAGTRLTVLETVTAEDGTTWYKVSYEDVEGYIRSDMAQVVDDSEQEPAEDIQEEEPQPEITRYDYKSDEVNVKVTLTDPADLPDNAELSVTPVELTQEAEAQITEKAIKEQKAIEKLYSYDIKFLVDGEEVQPGNTVKVAVTLNNEKKINDADVYHVDDENNIENMDGNVDKNGNVEFETTHFSTYVIVDNKRNGKINVTIEHYDGTTNPASKIYADDVRELTIGQKVDCKKAENWDISKVEVVTVNGTSTVQPGEFNVAQDATVKVYYTPVTVNFAGAPTFYDYTVKAGSDYSINQQSNYGKNKDSKNKLTMGEAKQNYQNYGYNWTKDGLSVNTWTGSDAVIKGLLKGLDADGNVEFNYPDPGFFTNSDLLAGNSTDNYLRKVYRDYTLNFDRSGDTYTLTGVTDGNGKNVTEQYNLDKNGKSGADFFPLDSVRSSYEKAYTRKVDSQLTEDNKIHNYYFGMRYDIKFKLGDYIGPLSYSFTGDDDMWVVLDGKQVVIDLGGIHNAATSTVDLWKYLLNTNQDKTQLTDEQKKAEHTLTILYMERGAGASNCYMNFTIPNARISQVTTDALGTLTFNKVNKDGTGLSGASFALYTDEDCTTQLETVTSGKDGTVTFDRLRAGIYYLKELQAPAGYVKSDAVWTVEVTKTSDTLVTTTLKDSSGNEVTDNEIVNETPEEIIKSSMEYSKTAKVDSWNDRTYDINIKAASTSTSSVTTTTKAVADIMLVLDVSGSMDKKINNYTYIADNTPEGREKLDKKTTYYVEKDGSYKEMKYSKRYSEWYIGRYEASNYYTDYKIYTRETKTRLQALQDSVDQFITDTASKSPESKIGITAFSSDYDQDHSSNGATQGLLPAGKNTGEEKNKDILISFANNLKAYGGTTPAIGLNKAKELLDAVANDGNPKYVILFTDGAPTGNRTDDEWDSDAKTNAETAANALKEARYTVYTIGYGFDDNSNEAKFLAGDGSTNYPGIASPNCAFTANDATKLGEIFRDIQNTITQDIAITGATVTDIIDSRFDLLKDDGTLYTQDDLNNGVKVNGGTVSLVDGCYKIEWTDQTIPNKKKNGEWNKTVKVKAKDSFVGGTNVTTNVSPGSKISTGYGDVELPQPTINVKVNLVVKDKEVWIYKGDTVPTNDTILNQLFSESETSYLKGTIGAADANGHIIKQWFKKDEKGNRINIQEEDMATTPDGDTEYYLEVTYKPNTTSTDDSKKNTTTSDGMQHFVGDEKAYNPNNRNLYGTYKIHVIKGQLQIIKNVTEASSENRTFAFNVKDKDGNDVSNSPVIVTVKAGETSGNVTLADLSRGSYTVTEANTPGYTISAFEVGTETDCENSKSDVSNESKSLTFVLGNDVNKKNVITGEYTYTAGGVKGVASYTNEARTNLDLQKTDTEGHFLTGSKFRLERKEGDSWIQIENEVEVKNDSSEIELNNLESGIYKLTEITSPKGYSILGSSIYFKVELGNVTLVNEENGNPAQDGEMWTLENKVLTIKNAKLYSLPSAGGPGIYGFTISGVAILATALLLFINNKRREEEAKKA